MCDGVKYSIRRFNCRFPQTLEVRYEVNSAHNAGHAPGSDQEISILAGVRRHRSRVHRMSNRDGTRRPLPQGMEVWKVVVVGVTGQVTTTLRHGGSRQNSTEI